MRASELLRDGGSNEAGVHSGCGADGVARVETRISFLNGLVSILTLSIFTPMEIMVTCGQGEAEDLQGVTDAAGFKAALDSGEPFLVRLPQETRG